MNFTLKILSPLHIGCGDVYTGLNYIIDQHKLYYLELDSIFSTLGMYKDQYVQWLDQKSNQLFELNIQKQNASNDKRKELNKKISEIKRSFELGAFIQQNKWLNFTIFKEKSIYKIPVKDGLRGSEDIHKFIHQMNRIYIPGTEVKGAIRSAILYHFLKHDQGLYAWLKNKINEFGNTNKDNIDKVKNQKRPDSRIKKRLNQGIEKISSQLELKAFYAPGQRDAKYDILKYLLVSDSELKKPDQTLCVTVATPMNSSRWFRIYSEYCIPGIKFNFTDLTLENNSMKKDKLNFSTNQKRSVSDISTIMKSCYEFSHDLLEEEISYFSSHKKWDIVNDLQMIQNQNEENSPVIRMGKDEGFLSLTIGMLIKARDPNLYENVLIHATKGVSYDAAHSGPLPKTRKIVSYEGRSLTSGWCKLILNNSVQ